MAGIFFEKIGEDRIDLFSKYHLKENINDRNLVLSYSHRELPNDPDNPVPARVRAPLAAIRKTRLARYPLFGADSIR